MNKLFIGLLIIAAGAGAFFFLRKKNDPANNNDMKKEWIVGKWKIDSLQAGKDSVFGKFSYDFQKDGNILRSLNDSAKADTSFYEWSKKNELVWKEKAGDSTSNIF